MFFSLGLVLHSQNAGISKQEAMKLTSEFPVSSQISRDSAILLFQESKELFAVSKDTCWQIRANCRYAIELGNSNQQEAALQQIQEAQELLQNSSCFKDYEIYIDLARVSLKSDMLDEEGMSILAYECLKKYRSNPIDSIIYLQFMLATGDENSDLNKAITYQDTALQWATALKNPTFQQRALINGGTFHAWLGDFDGAKPYFLEATRYSRGDKKYNNVSTLFNNLAGLSDQPEEVLLYIDSAIYYANLAGNVEAIQNYTQNKAIYYTMIGDYEEAYFSLLKSMQLKDTLLNRQKIMAVTEMEEKYKAERQSNEIKDLKLANLEAETRFQKNRNRLLFGLFLLLSLAGFLATRYYISNKHRRVLKSKNLELSIAHERSDQLLLNILPEDVASELKLKGQADARKYDNASILFTDFIDFTREVAQLSSEQLLEELNFYFRAFDEITEANGIEKIKTIGDSYMAVGGLVDAPKNAAKRTVLAALQMQQVVKARSESLASNEQARFQMRIGIHTGPIVAGIVGATKFQYDVWGDSVNTASRMENASEAGKVNISEATYILLKDDADLVFESRGKIEAKGKGEVEMWFVSSKVAETA